MRRLPLLIRCIVLAILMLLPACATTSNDANRVPSPPAAAQPNIITLTLWHSWSGAQFSALNSLARTYEQDHPNVRISLITQPATDIVRNYSTNVADGSAPQIVLLPGRYIGELAEQQLVAPLEEAIDQAILDPLLPATVTSLRIGERLYGVPLTYNTLVLFYDLRRVPEPPTTVDATLALNTAERDQPPPERPYSLGYYLSLEATLPYLTAFGGSIVNGEGQIAFASSSRDATGQWLDWLRALQINENVLATADFGAVDSAIGQDRVLSVIDWSYRRANYAGEWGEDVVGIAPLPAIGEAQPRTVVLPEALAINPVTSPDQRAVAEDVVRYMVSQSAQEVLWSRGALLPVHQTAGVTREALAFRSIAQQGQELAPSVTNSVLWTPLNEMLQQVVRNGATPSDAIDVAGAKVQPTPSP